MRDEAYAGPGTFFTPDGRPAAEALARATHLAVGAHQDDLEIMAADAILACRADGSFTGVVVTDGGGSPRTGAYAAMTDDEMKAVRAREQEEAARIGGYGALVQLGFPSTAVKDDGSGAVRDALRDLVAAARPRFVYTHNLADRHDTHVAVTLRVIEALRMLDEADRPEAVFGCEVWRDLDWLLDGDKRFLDVSDDPTLQEALLTVFASQVQGGKRYDLAVMGRRRAHATFSASHATDAAEGIALAMDLTPLMHKPGLDPGAYVGTMVERFAEDVRQRVQRFRRA